ncbi:unnamed protein product [Macrosiphum euphorbiae]|uniref:ribonuclease H n=1 Tax=Macrosiphum euphorbiae TaxID=13131 RepID=A0AAV0XZW6_9HEMI|nr:unnamed protein product [Macrosiphum euphorbiae]CAI6373104.1 unnamed protein product [Macrosiphum euphorbiae]
MGEYQLINNNTIKILGIIFDRKCSWTHHINSLKNSISPRLNVIKMLSHTSWGSKTHVLLTIYKSLILSKFDYGSFIWTTAHKSISKKLDTIHNSGLRMSIGAYRSSPIPSIYNLACTQPLDIRRLKITLNHELKLASTLPTLDFKPIFQMLPSLLQENNLDTSKILTITPSLTPQWKNLIETNTELSIFKKDDTPPSIYKKEYFHIIQNITSEKMYTDASKSQDGVGAAVIWNNSELMYKLPSTCSVFTAESIAILKALDIITDHHLQDTIIFTDSLSAINNIKNTYNPSDIGLHIQNKIHTLQYHNNFKIKLFWIPGHSSIKENELADLAAKSAISSPLSTSSQIISSSDIRSLITKKCQQTWHQRWTSYYTKLNRIKHNTVNWTFPIEIHRKFEVIITRLRIGHTKISHSFLMAKEEPPMCPSCGVQVTISHILTECQTYHNTRTSHNLPESLSEILSNHPQAIVNIIKFIAAANLQTKI